LDDHLEKRLASTFSPKFLFLAFSKDIESLLEMLILVRLHSYVNFFASYGWASILGMVNNIKLLFYYDLFFTI
jgi:hypothetical protein